MWPCTISRTYPRAFWQPTRRVQTQMLSFSPMEIFSGQSQFPIRLVIIKHSQLCHHLTILCLRFCARESPTATGPGARRCATWASAPGHTTARTLTFTFMTTWWVVSEQTGLELIITSKVKMDLRQFGKYNQFKILKQDAIKEVTRYVRTNKLYYVHVKLLSVS